MSETIERPLPHPSELSKAYWQGTSEGRLLIQTCANCGKMRHYPRWMCDACHSFDVRWTEACGRGQVHSWMVAHHPFHAAFKSELPYTLVTVDLEEGIRAVGRYEARSGTDLRIGLPVVLEMHRVAEGIALPHFRPDAPK
jgi:uncharacterized OB-fold protein